MSSFSCCAVSIANLTEISDVRGGHRILLHIIFLIATSHSMDVHVYVASILNLESGYRQGLLYAEKNCVLYEHNDVLWSLCIFLKFCILFIISF